MNHAAENFEIVDRCPVCISSSISPYKKGPLDYHSLSKEQIQITDKNYGMTWDLSRCESCSHVFANPRPMQSFISCLYSEVEDPLYQVEAEGREKNFDRILSCLEELQPQKGSLFDVGAATGILLNLAKQRGWNPGGIEASSWAVQVALQQYQLNLLRGDFETAAIPAENYDVVSMVDFIEHIPHPLRAMEKAHEILIPGGILCLVTPDIKSAAAKIRGDKWWHFRPGHLGYFTAKSLVTLVERTGFRVVKERKYAWTFSAHYLISRIPRLNFLLKNSRLSSFWKRIPIKLALRDSFEIYVRKVITK